MSGEDVGSITPPVPKVSAQSLRGGRWRDECGKYLLRSRGDVLSVSRGEEDATASIIRRFRIKLISFSVSLTSIDHIWSKPSVLF